MAGFSQKVSEIQAALAALLRDLQTSDAKIDAFGKGLAGSVENAKNITDLTNAVKRLAQATSEVNTSAFSQVTASAKQLEQTLSNLNITGVTKTTQALEQQAQVLRQVAALQDSINIARRGPIPSQEIFKARQQTALSLIQQKAPGADEIKALQLAADLAEGQAQGRVRLGGGTRLRTDQLSQEFEAIASQKSINVRGIEQSLSQQNYVQQYNSEGSAAAIAAQEKVNAANARRAQEIDALNSIDADMIAAQKRQIEQALRVSAEEEKLALAAQQEAAARKEAAEAARAARRAPYEQQAAGLSPTAQTLLRANKPEFFQGQGDLLDKQQIARLEQQAKLYQQVSREAEKLSGGKTQLVPQGFSAQSYIDLSSGLTKVVAQAQTAEGHFVNLNGHLNSNGKLVADLSSRYGGLFDVLGKNITKVAEFAFATAAVYGAVRKLGDAFKTVVDTQDELTQISLAIKDLGENAERFQTSFLNQSVQAGIRTGQGFEESLQTGLSAFRLTANVQNLPERQQVASRLTETELGTQSVFGLTKEQSIDSIGAIYRQIVDSGRPAAEAVSDVNTLLDKFVVASRNSGVVGKELVQTFAQLYGSAKELGATDNQLVGITAAFSQVSNKSPAETATALKTLTERIYGAGAQDLADLGIAVKEIDQATGTARFRPIIDILKDAYQRSKESEAVSLQISQAIGSQRRAPEAKLLVQSVPEIERLTTAAGTVDKGGGQFKSTLQELQQNYTQTINRLSLVFDRFVQRILLDGGLLKDVTNFVKGLADVLERLSDIKDPQVFRNIKEGLAVLGAGALASALAGFTFVKRITLQFQELIGAIRGATVAEEQFKVAASSPVGVGAVSAAAAGGSVPVTPRINREKLQQGILALGAVAIPAFLELQSEGASVEGLTGAGARIAGGFIGFMVGGPGGALVGQEIGKFISDAIDLPGVFGTSEREKAGFTSAATNLSEQEINQLRNVRTDQLQGLRDNFQGNALASQAFNLAGRRGITSEGLDQQKAAFEAAGIDPALLRKIAASTGNGSVQEVLDFVEQLSNSGSKLNQEINDLRKQKSETSGSARDFNLDYSGSSTNISEAQLNTGKQIFDTVDQQIERIKQRLNQQVEGIGQGTTSLGLAQYGPGGPQYQQLQQQYLGGQIDVKQYQAGVDSLKELPTIAGQVLPLFQELGISTDGVIQKLYTLGPAAQQNFQQLIEPVIQAQQVTKEYEATQAAILALEALKPQAVNTAEAQQISEEIELLKQKLALKQADYAASKQYLSTVTPSLGNSINNLFGVYGKQQGTTIKGSPGSPAQFQAPGILNVDDYGIDQVRKALDETRKKQAELVKMFPEYAKEFAKQQFLLESGGGFKAVGGINQQFFNQALQEGQKQRLEKPDLVDLSKYSNEKIGQILERAANLQSQAVKLAPDLAQDAEKSRLLILRKNNDLLAQNGLSQEFLRAAIDDLTQSNEDVLRGHFNLPADYRAPTIFDYYDKGGREKGSINYPPVGGGEASLDLAQKIVDAILASQGKGGGGGTPNLAALGNTIEPGARPIGYPNPGTPGTPDKYIPPPSLPGLPGLEDLVPKQRNYAAEYKLLNPDYTAKKVKDTGVDPAKIKADEDALDQHGRHTTDASTRLNGLSAAAGKTAESQKSYADTIPNLILNSKNAADAFSKIADLNGVGLGKEMSSAVRTSLLQGFSTIPAGAIHLNVVINGQTVPTDNAKVTIQTPGAVGGGSQTLGATAPTARGRPQ